jgi:hypothetical protein
MKKTLTSRVGADGTLNLNVVLSPADANKEVHVTVETLEPISDRAAWIRFLDQMAGAIDDPTFERHPQGDYEIRDALS